LLRQIHQLLDYGFIQQAANLLLWWKVPMVQGIRRRTKSLNELAWRHIVFATIGQYFMGKFNRLQYTGPTRY